MKKFTRKYFEFFCGNKQNGLYLGRQRTADAAFVYRMGAGFPGSINRVHPFSAEPNFLDPTNPPTLYGQPVILDATSKLPRMFIAGDVAVTAARGFVVRTFPTQQSTATTNAPATFNSGGPNKSLVQDLLRFGYIMVQLGNGTLTGAVKGGAVFVWCAASTGAHVQGGIETVASGGNTAALDTTRYEFNGVQDANGVVEIYVR